MRLNGSDWRALKTAAVAQRRRRESVKRVARWPEAVFSLWKLLILCSVFWQGATY